MNEEFLLSMKNAEHCNQQRRISINTVARVQKNINLVNGLSPYLISKPNKCSHHGFSNEEASSSSQTIDEFCDDDNIDCDLNLPEDDIEKTEVEDIYITVNDEDDNLFLLKELFSLKNQNNSIPLHPYMSVTTSEFCTLLVRAFQQANLCKSYSSRILGLFHLAMPQTNNLPASMNAVNQFLEGKLQLVF